MKEKMLQEFKRVYGEDRDVKVYFAPGRVNLIGEHTDYNGGHVFPCALTMGTYAAVRRRDDNKLRFYSANFDKLGVIETSLDDLVWDKAADWTNYPKGVMWAYMQKGYHFDKGFDMCYLGNIPNGSGLSSSASIEVLTALVLKDTFGFSTDFIDMHLSASSLRISLTRSTAELWISLQLRWVKRDTLFSLTHLTFLMSMPRLSLTMPR